MKVKKALWRERPGMKKEDLHLSDQQMHSRATKSFQNGKYNVVNVDFKNSTLNFNYAIH